MPTTKKVYARKKPKKKDIILSERGGNLSSYFSHIGQLKILTKKEEQEHGKNVQKWVTNKRKCGGWTRKKAQKSRDILIRHNLKLVVKIANDYKAHGLDLEDLINEGNIGLMKAVEKFDPNKGVKFSTYASFWIKQSVFRALSNFSRTIRIPAHLACKSPHILEFIRKYKDKNDREPTTKEISKATGVSESSVTNLLRVNNQMISLESEMNEDESRTFAEVIEDKKAVRPDVGAESSNDYENLEKCLQKLTTKERYIIMRRFGVGHLDNQTLEVIGKRYNVTRERIRQIQQKAMRKLRRWMLQHYNKNELPDFLNNEK